MSDLSKAIENLEADAAAKGVDLSASINAVKTEGLALENAIAGGVTNAAESALDALASKTLGPAASVVEVPAHIVIMAGVNWLLQRLGVHNVTVPLQLPTQQG